MLKDRLRSWRGMKSAALFVTKHPETAPRAVSAYGQKKCRGRKYFGEDNHGEKENGVFLPELRA